MTLRHAWEAGEDPDPVIIKHLSRRERRTIATDGPRHKRPIEHWKALALPILAGLVTITLVLTGYAIWEWVAH